MQRGPLESKHPVKHKISHNQGTAHIHSHNLKLTSLRMLRQTVPDGYTLGWKKFAGNLHCTTIEELVNMGSRNSTLAMQHSLMQLSAIAGGPQTRLAPGLLLHA